MSFNTITKLRHWLLLVRRGLEAVLHPGVIVLHRFYHSDPSGISFTAESQLPLCLSGGLPIELLNSLTAYCNGMEFFLSCFLYILVYWYLAVATDDKV